MSNFNYSINLESYSWKNALLWGNFKKHCEKANDKTAKWGDRLVHVLIAIGELLPIIGQIASIFEKLIVTNCGMRSAYSEQMKLLWEKKRRRELEKDCPETSMSHFAMHLMMDKLFIKETGYEGSYAFITAHSMQKALERLIENQTEWMINEQCKQYLIELSAKLCPLLEKNQELSRLFLQPAIEDIVNEEYKKNIWESLIGLKEGESLLIPLSCEDHDTDLRIIKTSSSKFRLICYNTGAGLHKWHYRYQETNLYQTYDIIDEVPAESILNEEAWKAHFIKLLDNGTMDSLYEWIRNQIGKGGIRRPSSENEEDYEACQYSGTCSTQCKMALIRHEIMQIVTGTPIEKESCYKLTKTYLFLQFLKDHENEFDEDIKKYIPLIREKLEAEKTLIQIAGDEKQMQEALAIFKDILSNLGESTDIAIFNPEISFLNCYATLRKISLLIFKKIMAQKGEIFLDLLKQPALQLVSAKLNYYARVRENIPLFLNQCVEEYDSLLISRFIILLSYTPHTDIGFVETLKHLGKEVPDEKQPPKIAMELLKYFNKRRHENDALVKKLSLGLKDQGNIELSNWCLEHWENLAAQTQ